MCIRDSDDADPYHDHAVLILEARAYLAAQPEPAAGPSSEITYSEVLALRDKLDTGYGVDLVAFARAVAARVQANQSTPKPAARPTDKDLYDLAEVFNGDPIPAMRRALELYGH